MKNKFEYDKVKSFSNLRDMLEKAKDEAGEVLAFRHKENKEAFDVTYNQFHEHLCRYHRQERLYQHRYI